MYTARITPDRLGHTFYEDLAGNFFPAPEFLRILGRQQHLTEINVSSFAPMKTKTNASFSFQLISHMLRNLQMINKVRFLVSEEDVIAVGLAARLLIQNRDAITALVVDGNDFQNFNSRSPIFEMIQRHLASAMLKKGPDQPIMVRADAFNFNSGSPRWLVHKTKYVHTLFCGL